MDEDGIVRPAAGGPGEELSDAGAHISADRARPWWRRRRVALLVIVVVAGASLLWVLDGRYGARGWCNTAAGVRAELGDAVTDLDTAEEIFVAQVALATEEAPALVARADRMVWPRGDLADRVAAALAEVATAEQPGDQTIPLQRFVELDNEFFRKHCNSRWS